MWYFSWILGIGLAVSFAILNAMWFEVHADSQAQRRGLTSGHLPEFRATLAESFGSRR